VGIDLGATAFHVVVVQDRELVGGGVFAEPEAVVDVCDGADRVAIDAPSAPSTGVHAADTSLPGKFRTARCGEIAARDAWRVSVSWTTPAAGGCPGWMENGFRLWSALRESGHDPIEVYPAGSVQLGLGRVPTKKTPAGLAVRRALLAEHLTLPWFVDHWGHDGIDAALAAAVAAQGAAAIRAGHDDPACDGSAIWLLRPVGA
jgi:predicted nuclease with RNAse H fold